MYVKIHSVFNIDLPIKRTHTYTHIKYYGYGAREDVLRAELVLEYAFGDIYQSKNVSQVCFFNPLYRKRMVDNIMFTSFLFPVLRTRREG